MLQVLEFRIVTQAARKRVSDGSYLNSTVILIFIPVCTIWAEPKFIWCHPLIKGSLPLRGYFVHHPLLSQVNLQVLSNLISECWPGTLVSTCFDIVKTGLPWFVFISPRRGRIHRFVWYLSIFHSKGLNAAFCGQKYNFLPIYIHFFELLKSSPQRSWVQFPLKKLEKYSGALVRQSLRLSGRCEDHFFNSLSQPETETHEPNKVTSSHHSSFKTQLERALHRHRKDHGFESRWRHLKDFQVHMWDNGWDCPTSVRIISLMQRYTRFLWREEVRFRSLWNTNSAVKWAIWNLHNFCARHTFTDQGWCANHLPVTIEIVSARLGSENVFHVNGIRHMYHVFWVRRMRLII